ncbi:MAG TPA: VCBS repeat-containing protein [Terriglobia bacterium]|nr:VCBS repeat-containing protein [Terriglobia bacterium]
MHARSLVTRSFRFPLIALLLLASLHAIPDFAGSHEASPKFNSGIPSYNLPVFSDFDGDNKLDQAALSSYGSVKKIRITFGKSAWSLLSFDSGVPERGRLVSGDIDSDGDADLVWVSQGDPAHFVMWYGDGRGNFFIATEPARDIHRIQTLLADHSAGLTGNSNGVELLCVLLSTSLAGPRTVAYYPYLVPTTHLFSATQVRAVSAPCLSVLRKRGPPSKLS